MGESQTFWFSLWLSSIIITNHHPDNSVPTYHHLTLTQQLLGCSLPMRFSIDRSMMIFATVTITIMIISITTMIMMILSASWQWSWWLSASWQWLWWWKLSHFSSTITLIQRTPGNPERFSMSHFPTRMFMSWWWRIWPEIWTEKSWMKWATTFLAPTSMNVYK